MGRKVPGIIDDALMSHNVPHLSRGPHLSCRNLRQTVGTRPVLFFREREKTKRGQRVIGAKDPERTSEFIRGRESTE